MTHATRRVRLAVLAAVAAIATLFAGPIPHATGLAATVVDTATAAEDVYVLSYVLAGETEIDRFVATGVDLAEYVKPLDGGGYEMHAVVSPTEVGALARLGFSPVATITSPQDFQRVLEEREDQMAAEAAAAEEESVVRVLRADTWVARNGSRALSVEAKHSRGGSGTDVVTVQWDSGPGTEMGSGGSATMSRFTDAGQYIYHRIQTTVTTRPSMIRVTAEDGSTASAEVRDWVNDRPAPPEGDYVKDFISHYIDPTEAYDRIDALAAEFPGLTEIIELPYRTNGYARTAFGMLGNGNAAAAAVVLHSKAKGHEGGNDVVVEAVHSLEQNHPLTVRVNGSTVTVELATNAVGVPTSTAADVVAALNEHAGEVVSAYTYRGNAGTGPVAPGSVQLDDRLDAPASISREPFTVRAIRIRGDRQNTHTGVFLYSQEHAREWVTPLVAVETAERLLRNYGQDPATTQLVNDLDIFIIPSINPDGAHYSFHDFNMQRRSMANHCGPAQLDPARENSWGVDLNRNFTAGSIHDGYSGASNNCLSDVYAGPFELSEAETRNEVWLTEQYPNIKFSMNTHTYGDYFMWAPGAYKTPGREQLPRPDAGTDAYFYQAGENILEHVADHRGTVVTPARTGPVSDVLYSAAGNSADEHWYNRGIFGWSFECGGIGFQPAWADAHEEAMEYANGWIGILHEARRYELDTTAPTSSLEPGAGAYAEPVRIRFGMSEPSRIYYTLDGSTPTFDSNLLQVSGVREGAQTFLITQDTTVKWFAVDMKGNVENGYDPAASGPGGKGKGGKGKGKGKPAAPTYNEAFIDIV